MALCSNAMATVNHASRHGSTSTHALIPYTKLTGHEAAAAPLAASCRRQCPVHSGCLLHRLPAYLTLLMPEGMVNASARTTTLLREARLKRMGAAPARRACILILCYPAELRNEQHVY